MKRNITCLIKDLELQIDFLIAYSPSGLHWKQEYSARQTLLEETLASESTPKEIREKIFAIQQKLYEMREGKANDQPYLKSIEEITISKHKIQVNDFQNNSFYQIEI